jgi:hypothetical protein
VSRDLDFGPAVFHETIPSEPLINHRNFFQTCCKAADTVCLILKFDSPRCYDAGSIKNCNLGELTLISLGYMFFFCLIVSLKML